MVLVIGDIPTQIVYIHRIIKDDPIERAILLKELKKHCNVEYEGDYKALDVWLDRVEYDLFEEIQEKIIDEQCKHEYEKELKQKTREPMPE